MRPPNGKGHRQETAQKSTVTRDIQKNDGVFWLGLLDQEKMGEKDGKSWLDWVLARTFWGKKRAKGPASHCYAFGFIQRGFTFFRGHRAVGIGYQNTIFKEAGFCCIEPRCDIRVGSKSKDHNILYISTGYPSELSHLCTFEDTIHLELLRKEFNSFIRLTPQPCSSPLFYSRQPQRVPEYSCCSSIH